jgi:hypothetical protein
MKKKTQYILTTAAVVALAGSGLGIASASASSTDTTAQTAAAVAVSTSESFLGAQVTLDPPGSAANAAGLIAPSDALKLDSAGMMGKPIDAATVEFGLYTNTTQGTDDPQTGVITNLLHQKRPVYFLIHHGESVGVGNGRTFSNETVVTIVDARSGKWISQFGQPAAG